MKGEGEQDLSTVIEKIEKLLALSGSANEHEAALATAKANDLLVKYELTMEQVRLHDQEDGVGTESRSYVNTQKAQRWEQMLAAYVARHNFCEVLVGPYRVTFVGRDDARKVSVYVYQQLARALHKMARRETRAYIKRQKAKLEIVWNEMGLDREFDHRKDLRGAAHHKSWRASWLDGAVDGIGMQLRKQRKVHEQSEKSNALVVVRDAEVQEYLQARYGKMKSKIVDSGKNWDAYRQGHQAGSDMQINPGLEQSNSSGQLE